MIGMKRVKVFGVFEEAVWNVGDEEVKDFKTFCWRRGPISWVRRGVNFVSFIGDDL